MKWIPYQDYIDKHYSTFKECYGMCASASKAMQTEFPELAIVKGHIYCSWGKRQHTWLVTKNGKIVDPTAKQFPAVSHYEEWKPGDELRVGKCMNCGDDIYRSVQDLDHVKEQCICDEQCAEEFRRYLARDVNDRISTA